MCIACLTIVALSLQVLAHVKGMADAEQHPSQFPTTPALAVPKALANAAVTQQEVDYWEINQAFAVVDIVNQRLLGLDGARYSGCTSCHNCVAAAVISIAFYIRIWPGMEMDP